MGNSTDVPLDQRLSIWVELVPRLLAHLEIEHVALVSHCAGTIYLLNTLFYCRELLHPKKPFVAFLGISFFCFFKSPLLSLQSVIDTSTFKLSANKDSTLG